MELTSCSSPEIYRSGGLGVESTIHELIVVDADQHYTHRRFTLTHFNDCEGKQ